MPLVRLCSKSELPADGQAAEIALDQRVICVANVDGEISAMDNVCLHRGGPLGQGTVTGGKIVCPWHAWMYDLRTGATSDDSAMRVRVYPIKVVGDDVMVDLE